MTTKSPKETTAASPSQPATVWRATINKMPPPPDVLHVRGQVEVPNPGVDVFLNRRNPQGINLTILLLDLVLVQQPGQWPQVLVTKLATYEEKERDLAYVTVEIHREGQPVVSIPVEIIQ